MEKHITLVGILNIVYSGFAFIGSLVLFTLGFGFRYIMDMAMRMDPHEMQDVPPEVFSIVPIVLTFFGIIVLLIAAAGIIGSIGVLKKKEWGRLTVLVISFFHLIHVPLGTILGVYSIWALLNDDMIKLFNPAAETKSKKR